MTGMICDRCGKIISLGEQTLTWDDGEDSYDLCSDCLVQLREWINRRNYKEKKKTDDGVRACRNCRYFLHINELNYCTASKTRWFVDEFNVCEQYQETG